MTADPVYDMTPLQRVNVESANAPGSPVPDCTPVWHDTPSQTVDGTEEVTQEHNI